MEKAEKAGKEKDQCQKFVSVIFCWSQSLYYVTIKLQICKFEILMFLKLRVTVQAAHIAVTGDPHEGNCMLCVMRSVEPCTVSVV